MRASRLLSILMLLQTRGRMSASALAAELEVTQRTVLRDMDQLSAAEVPVWAERGRDGGFQLRAGWSSALTGLTQAEAQAFFLAGVPGAATELGLGGAALSAHVKLLAALPEEWRDDAMRVSARLHIDPIEWYRAASPPEHLQTVASAVWRQQPLVMRYESWTGLKNRAIKPLGLVLKAGNWYLVALADGGATPRTYRLASIRALTVRGGAFKYPKAFHLASYWQAATKRFEAEVYTGSAVLQVTARGLQRVGELSAIIGEAAQRSRVPDPADENLSQIRVPIESIEHAASQLLGLGADVQVLEPAALRSHMGKMIKAVAALYDP